MIRKLLLSRYLVRTIGRLTVPYNCFSTAGAIKVLRENDAISQSDIDSILGNEPSEK